FTYKVQAPRETTERGGRVTDFNSDIRFVKVLANGSADSGNFVYLGIVRDGRLTLTRASKAGLDAPSLGAFKYFLSVPTLPAELVVHHWGTCGRCGRTLTVPESIAAGIGPECATKNNLPDID